MKFRVTPLRRGLRRPGSNRSPWGLRKGLPRKSVLRKAVNHAIGRTKKRNVATSGGELPPRRVRKPRRIGKHWQFKAAVVVKRGGREMCNPATPEGRAEYFWRILMMWVRQEGFCCNCGNRLKLKEATFEHENGRGAAKQDDRIALFDEDGRFIRNINGASHLECNSERGSRRTEIFHGNNLVLEMESL